MKQFIGILWVVLFGIACRGDRMKAFAPGTYVRFVESGAGKAWDTLRIAPLGGKYYRVERSIGEYWFWRGTALVARSQGAGDERAVF